MEGASRNIIEPGIRHSGNKQWPTLLLRRIAHRIVIPERNSHFLRHLLRFASHRLAQGQRKPWRSIGDIFPQHQHRVRQLHFMQRWRPGRTLSQNIED